MKKIIILFSGNGTNFNHIIKTLHKKELEIVLAITNNPNSKGINIAKENNIPIEIIDSKKYKNRKDFDKVLVDKINEYNPDLTVLAGFMRILTEHFTENIKAINLHPSLLPHNKGLNAIERSFEDSYPVGGISVHFVSLELDDGEIILQKEIIKKSLSFEEYEAKVKELEKEVLSKSILKILNK